MSVFATGGFVVFALIPSTIFMFVEDWTFFEAFYYCVITLGSEWFTENIVKCLDKNEGVDFFDRNILMLV